MNITHILLITVLLLNIEKTFTSLSQAEEEENGESRMYLGVHFNFDKINGMSLGRNVGIYVKKEFISTY